MPNSLQDNLAALLIRRAVPAALLMTAQLNSIDNQEIAERQQQQNLPSAAGSKNQSAICPAAELKLPIAVCSLPWPSLNAGVFASNAAGRSFANSVWLDSMTLPEPNSLG